MWVGSNTLELNESTFKEAVQYWLTNKVLASGEPTPTVESVKAGTNPCGTFLVRLKAESD